MNPSDAPRSRAAKSRGFAAGFTMVEMLAVIIILGLIATIVTVNWRAMLPKTELHSAVRTLAGTLEGTRSDAIARNGLFEIQYDLEHHRYRVVTPFKVGGGLALNNEDRHAQDWNELPQSVRFKSITIDGIEYTKGMINVRFDPLGTAVGHTIILEQKPDNNLYTVEVQGLLGLIDYHEGLFTRTPPKEQDFR